jgi:hypothetical protein
MKTQQTFDLKPDGKYLPSDIQALRHNAKEMSKSLQKTKSKESTVHDLSGLSWIVFEEYD